MTFSMTGYATLAAELEQGALALEVRSVNHRYLDIQMRMCDELRSLETVLREAIGKQLARGKVECRVAFVPLISEQTSPQLNSALLGQLARLNKQVKDYLPDAQPLSVLDILRWPGMRGVEGQVPEGLQDACLKLLQNTLKELNAARAREGEQLRQMIIERIDQMESLLVQVEPHIPRLLAAYGEKLVAKLAEAGVDNDDNRIRQELVLFAQRIDVDEELVRLRTHTGEVRRVLSGGGAVGKRLDFLMQELNREANTLGSKSVVSEVSQIALELKVLIEQMREQVQNIE
ncbi:MAG: YicC/YloC family endoribonuclease [Burkholderiales bacterium]